MLSSEEVKKIRSKIRKDISKWKNENPNWDTSDSMKYLETKVSTNTFKSYKSILPLFCHWENTTPEQMLSHREKQSRSDARALKKWG